MCLFLVDAGFYFVCICLCLLIKNITKTFEVSQAMTLASPWLWPLTSAWWSHTQLVHAVSLFALAELHPAWLTWWEHCSQDSSSPQSQVLVLSVKDKPAYHSSPLSRLCTFLYTTRILEQEKSSRQSSSLLVSNFPSYSITFCFLEYWGYNPGPCTC